MYVADQLKETAIKYPDRIVTIFKGRKKTYKEFYNEAKKLAAYFQYIGLKKNDVIALYMNNSDYFLISYFACHVGGFTALPVNTKLATPEVEYILKHSDVKGIVYDNQFRGKITDIKKKTPTLEDRLINVGDRKNKNSFEIIIKGEARPLIKPTLKDEDVAVIFYTSGTTGKPKGVMLTNKNVKSVAQINSQTMELTSEDRVQILTPLFHCGACHTMSIPTIYVGGSLVIEEKFSPDENLNSMEQESVTVFFGVTPIFSRFLDDDKITTFDLGKLRLIAFGAGPTPFEHIKKLKMLLPHVKLMNLYGQTENSPAATGLKDEYIFSKISSVGKPAPKTEVRVVDVNGEYLPFDQVGEVVVKGPQVMKGYLKNEKETMKALKDGWLYTGDLGRFDKEGFLYLVDRKKDLIIRGGENIYPVEVEEVLYQIPEILEAAVVGIPHEDLGEVVKAYVVTKKGKKLTEKEILSFCEKRLARYKNPVQITFLDSLPRNANRKVLKTELRKEIVQN